MQLRAKEPKGLPRSGKGVKKVSGDHGPADILNSDFWLSQL